MMALLLILSLNDGTTQYDEKLNVLKKIKFDSQKGFVSIYFSSFLSKLVRKKMYLMVIEK
ncbi:hypothetical protein [Brachyspira pilosicoli]|uniref:hypothetical protein n=1 Tax=Brachyspira pilosicoli TaxID=52584 RepID=UPI00300417A3|nr:hypothetical protein [Brachyspira pilosicoli]